MDRHGAADHVYVLVAEGRLSHLPTNTSEVVRLLSLLGRFGGVSDEMPIRPFVDHPDDLVANGGMRISAATES